jgi:hypothetical protein
VLGGLIGKTAQEVFTAAAELKRRDLLQQRREWRAVLPHAIANRLAAMALENIPYAVIDSAIVQGSSERLLRSFSRRLGYLDGSKEARTIVKGWLGPTGLLSDVLGLNELGRAMFENVAPVLPEATLSALENVFANADKETLLRGGHFIRLLHSLAYDAALFERAVKLLSRFASVLDEGSFDGEAARAIAPLFYIVFSGTRAPLPMRLTVLDSLLKSDEPVEQHLGIKALEAMMKPDHFMPYATFEFGARSRDYGYHPKTGKEVGQWFEDVLSAAEPLSLGDGPVMARVRKTIAGKFRGLWTHGGRLDALERISKAITGSEFWRDGWVAARQTRQYDGRTLNAESLQRLTQLEEFLRPKDIVNCVRGIVLGERGGGLELDDFDDDDDEEEVTTTERLKRAAMAVQELGKDVATDEKAIATLVPELIGGSGRLGEFGHGLALGAITPRDMWNRLVAAVALSEKPNMQVLCGFLSGLQTRDIAQTNALLDDAIADATLGEWLPELQASVTIDEAGVRRLRRALELDRAPVGHFFVLVYGGVCEPISGPAFRDLMLAIGAKPDGNRVALEILSMRLHSDGTAKRKPLPETVEAGRLLLAQHQFSRRGNAADHDDYKLGVVASNCLIGPEGAPVAQQIWRDLKDAIERYDAYAWEQDDLLRGLFKTQPVTMLDELVAGSDADRRKSIEIIHEAMRHSQHPLNVVPDQLLLDWCDADPNVRYPFAAATALLFARPNDQTPHEWQPIAKKLLERAPDPVAVFQAISLRLWPMSFSGSVASKFESRLQLLDKLEVGSDPALVASVNAARAALAAKVEELRRSELEDDREQSGRFE